VRSPTGGQSEGIIEFPIGKESGVTGDGGAVELRLELAVEIDAERVIVAVTNGTVMCNPFYG